MNCIRVMMIPHSPNLRPATARPLVPMAMRAHILRMIEREHEPIMTTVTHQYAMLDHLYGYLHTVVSTVPPSQIKQPETIETIEWKDITANEAATANEADYVSLNVLYPL